MDSVVPGNHNLDAVKEELALDVTRLEEPNLKPRSAPVTSTKEHGTLIQQDSVIVSTRVCLSSQPSVDSISNSFSDLSQDAIQQLPSAVEAERSNSKWKKTKKKTLKEKGAILIRAHSKYGSYAC